MCMVEPHKTESRKRSDLRALETSIRAAVPAPEGGRIVTMGFPGLTYGHDGRAYIDPERLEATLGHEALEGGRLLVVLVEPQEVPCDAMDLLDGACAARGMRLCHLPIEDYKVPGDAFHAGWAQVADLIRETMREGGALGLSCHYGAGRSGMIAAGLLIDQGVPPGEAILTLRAQFPESIESEMQLAWLKARGAARGAQAG